MYLESRGERPPCRCPKMSAMPSAPISPWCGRGSTNRDSMSRRCSSACGRRTARSHNHLLGVIRCFFDWLVVQERIAHSPVRIGPRRTGPRPMPFLFDCVLAKRFLDIARALPDRPRGPSRGPTYHLIFAMMYTLGLRVGEVSRLELHDVDLDRCVLSIRQTKFAKDRLVPLWAEAQGEAGRVHRRGRASCRATPPPGSTVLLSLRTPDLPVHDQPHLPLRRQGPSSVLAAARGIGAEAALPASSASSATPASRRTGRTPPACRG